MNEDVNKKIANDSMHLPTLNIIWLILHTKRFVYVLTFVYVILFFSSICKNFSRQTLKL